MKTIYIKDILKKSSSGKYVLGACALGAMLLLGSALAGGEDTETSGNSVMVGEGEETLGDAVMLGEGSGENVISGSANISGAGRILQDSAGMLQETENWGLGFGRAGERPTGNASSSQLAEYNAYFCSEEDENVIYLTFDCGFENGNTEAILDALKKHNATATFFVVGHYLETAPELVKRMVDEGHIVANHTYHHPDMSKISDAAAFQKEMDAVSALYKEITGQEMAMYYRPPQGKYSIQNLQMAKELGYATFFWSLAYVDWNQDSQPSHEEAYEKLTSRVHPGAIVLLHNTSKTNGEIMDGILTKWEEMGYTFGSLEDLVGTDGNAGEKTSTGEGTTGEESAGNATGHGGATRSGTGSESSGTENKSNEKQNSGSGRILQDEGAANRA